MLNNIWLSTFISFEWKCVCNIKLDCKYLDKCDWFCKNYFLFLAGTLFPFHSVLMIMFVSHSGFLERRIVSEASKIAFYSCKWFMCKSCPKAAWIWQQVWVNFVTFVAGILENSSEICLWSWLWLPWGFHKCSWHWIFNSLFTRRVLLTC